MAAYHFYPVRDIELAATLVLCNAKFYEPAPLTRIVKDRQEICCYNFVPDESTNRIGKEWLPENLEALKTIDLPEDVRVIVAIAKLVFMNKARMLDEIKRHAPLHAIERNGRTYLVTKK